MMVHPEYNGMDINEAVSEAKELGFTVRIWIVGERERGSTDYTVDRMNFAVQDGKVMRAWNG